MYKLFLSIIFIGFSSTILFGGLINLPSGILINTDHIRKVYVSNHNRVIVQFNTASESLSHRQTVISIDDFNYLKSLSSHKA